MKKKMVTGMIIILLGILLCSCASASDMLNSRIHQLNTEEYKTEKIVKKRQKQVVKYLKNGKKEKLRALFCKNTIESAENFEENLDRLFELMQDRQIKVVEIAENAHEGEYINEKAEEHWRYYDCVTLTLDVDAEIYKITIMEYLEDKKQPDNVGIYKLKVYSNNKEVLALFIPDVHDEYDPDWKKTTFQYENIE